MSLDIETFSKASIVLVFIAVRADLMAATTATGEGMDAVAPLGDSGDRCCGPTLRDETCCQPRSVI